MAFNRQREEDLAGPQDTNIKNAYTFPTEYHNPSPENTRAHERIQEENIRRARVEREQEIEARLQLPRVKRVMLWFNKHRWKAFFLITIIVLALFMTSAILQLVELQDFTKKVNYKLDVMDTQIQKLNIDIFNIGMKVNPSSFPQGAPNPLPTAPSNGTNPDTKLEVAPTGGAAAAFRNKDNFASTPEYLKELNVFKGMGPSEQLAYMKMKRNEKLLKYGPLVH